MKRRTVIHRASVLLLLALLAGCGSEGAIELPEDTAPRINPPVDLPAALDAWPTLDGRSPGVPDNYDPVAESDHLRLYLDEATSALVVEDKRNGKLWYSCPADLDDVRVSKVWYRRIQSPILLGYTDADRGRANVADPEDMEMDFAPVEGGVRATYRFPELGFEVSVIYVLHGDTMDVIVPEAEIVDGGETENTLVSLETLSFFGATRDGEEGYIVFPDGSGATMGYKSPHPEAVQGVSVSIYGIESFELQGGFDRPSARVPVFGLVSGDAAFVSFITHGDFDASLSAARSGKTTPYNHVWATSVYRRQGSFTLTGGQPALLYEPDLTGGDRRIRYCFLTEENANYVGMAIRYRDFLIEERGAQRVAGDAPLMSLDFFMGIERETWLLSDLVVMTTFADVQAFMEGLDTAGVSQVDVTVDGWNRDGAESHYPQRLPAEARFGGADGLRALAGDLRARGQRLYLTDDYIVAVPEGPGIIPLSDAVRGIDGLPVGEEGFYVINPQVALRQFVARDFPGEIDLGASGLRLNYFAALVVPDTNDRYPLSRESFAATYMQIGELTRDHFGAVAMTGGNSYAIPYADRLDWVPMDSTHYDIFDQTIPFYQIVAHGLVPYTGQPYNLINDGQRTFLHQVEYGAIPHYVLTRENSAELYRTFANEHWSTQYDFWRGDIVRQYRDMEKLAPLVDQFIVDHARLAEGVYQTTYEDGTRVVVNYNEEPHVLESVTVPALDFVVLPGSP